MSFKTVLRFLIGVLIAGILLQILVPLLGIPQAQLAPPMIAYNRANGQAKGIITSKRDAATPNPFRVGDKIYFVSYQFAAIAPAVAWDKAGAGKPKKYTGETPVSASAYEQAKVGAVVPVKYEKKWPVISGINSPNGGRSEQGGAGLFSLWILWAMLTLVLGYLLMTPIERTGLLRESF